jgi:hypothetical protein
VVIQPRFHEAKPFSEGPVAVIEGGKVGHVNRCGEMVIKPQFEDSTPCAEEFGYGRPREFSEGLGAAQTGGRWGYNDQGGRFVIKPQYDCARRLSEGLTVVGVRADPLIRIGYVDKAGNLAIKPQYISARPFSGGVAAVGVGGPGAGALAVALWVMVRVGKQLSARLQETTMSLRWTRSSSRPTKRYP